MDSAMFARPRRGGPALAVVSRKIPFVSSFTSSIILLCFCVLVLDADPAPTLWLIGHPSPGILRNFVRLRGGAAVEPDFFAREDSDSLQRDAQHWAEDDIPELQQPKRVGGWLHEGTVDDLDSDGTQTELSKTLVGVAGGKPWYHDPDQFTPWNKGWVKLSRLEKRQGNFGAVKGEGRGKSHTGLPLKDRIGAFLLLMLNTSNPKLGSFGCVPSGERDGGALWIYKNVSVHLDAVHDPDDPSDEGGEEGAREKSQRTAAAAAATRKTARTAPPAAVDLRVACQLGRNVLLTWNWKPDVAATPKSSSNSSTDQTQPKPSSKVKSAGEDAKQDGADTDDRIDQAWRAQIRFNDVELGEESLAGGEPWLWMQNTMPGNHTVSIRSVQLPPPGFTKTRFGAWSPSVRFVIESGAHSLLSRGQRSGDEDGKREQRGEGGYDGARQGSGQGSRGKGKRRLLSEVWISTYASDYLQAFDLAALITAHQKAEAEFHLPHAQLEEGGATMAQDDVAHRSSTQPPPPPSHRSPSPSAQTSTRSEVQRTGNEKPTPIDEDVEMKEAEGGKNERKSDGKSPRTVGGVGVERQAHWGRRLNGKVLWAVRKASRISDERGGNWSKQLRREEPWTEKILMELDRAHPELGRELSRGVNARKWDMQNHSEAEVEAKTLDLEDAWVEWRPVDAHTRYCNRSEGQNHVLLWSVECGEDGQWTALHMRPSPSESEPPRNASGRRDPRGESPGEEAPEMSDDVADHAGGGAARMRGGCGGVEVGEPGVAQTIPLRHRPGKCDFYMREGRCIYGEQCRFQHRGRPDSRALRRAIVGVMVNSGVDFRKDKSRKPRRKDTQQRRVNVRLSGVVEDLEREYTGWELTRRRVERLVQQVISTMEEGAKPEMVDSHEEEDDDSEGEEGLRVEEVDAAWLRRLKNRNSY